MARVKQTVEGRGTPMRDPLDGDSLDLSVVVPVCNEEDNVAELSQRLSSVLGARVERYEVIFVDDGSTDRSFHAIQQLHLTDPRVKAVKLSRNFGHHVAIAAGIDHARGRGVILMDGDLQDRPEEIPKLLAKFAEGYDVVYGVRDNYRESAPRRAASRLFWAVLTRLSGYPIPPHQTMLRIISRRVATQLRGMPEQARFTAGLIAWLGFRQTGVTVEHAGRLAGFSKYSLGRMLQFTFHVITSFSQLPLQLAGYLGLAISTVSFIGAAYLIIRRLVWGIPVVGWASLMVTMLLLGGIQLMIVGIIGEYLGRVFSEAQGRPLYVVDQTLGVLLPDGDPVARDG